MSAVLYYESLVARLNAAARYDEAVEILEQNTESLLAADVLGGATWARRYLNTTARFWMARTGSPERMLAQRGVKALMAVLAGTKPKRGRRRAPGLSPQQIETGLAAIERWREHVEEAFEAPFKLIPFLMRACPPGFTLSRAHQRALTALLRRRRTRRSEFVLSLASWETGIPIRRLKQMKPVADLVYR